MHGNGCLAGSEIDREKKRRNEEITRRKISELTVRTFPAFAQNSARPLRLSRYIYRDDNEKVSYTRDVAFFLSRARSLARAALNLARLRFPLLFLARVQRIVSRPSSRRDPPLRFG